MKQSAPCTIGADGVMHNLSVHLCSSRCCEGPELTSADPAEAHHQRGERLLTTDSSAADAHERHRQVVVTLVCQTCFP